MQGMEIFISKIKLCYNYSTLTLPSKKIIMLCCICVAALGSVVYGKIQPGSLLVSPALDLKVVQSTSAQSSLRALQTKVSTSESLGTTTFSEPSLTEAISQDFVTN